MDNLLEKRIPIPKISTIRPQFDRRTTLSEVMDDPSLSGQTLESELDNLDKINRLLGGKGVILQAVKEVVPNLANAETTILEIADLGCGGGDILRQIARWAGKSGAKVKLWGLDFNSACIRYAQQKSLKFPEIEYKNADVFSGEIADNSYDIVICSLFLHHFPDERQEEIYRQLQRISRGAVIVNDLQRHWLPFFLFRMVTWVFRAPAVVRYDGLISIMRGFSRKDLAQMMVTLGIQKWRIRWKWAFRYQLVFYTG
ncbi:MAG: methyltransferase domain-containing protein [Bacteroidia bacterium]